MPAKIQQEKVAIIIGAGVAGLASAIRLAVKGFRVSVYERNEYPGGKIGWFRQEGFSFDTGPSLFTEPHLIEELFLLANEPIAEYFNYKPVDQGCKYFFENGKQVEASSNPEIFANFMQDQLGEPSENVCRYLKNSSLAYDNIGKLFLKYSLHHFSDIPTSEIIRAIRSTNAAYLLKSLNEFNKGSFNTPEAVQIFNRFATYNGSNPYKAPAMLSVIPHLELNNGVFYPYGGMISITNALYRLAQKKGVQFHFNTTVERINHQDGKVTGVLANGQNIYATHVISNCDVYFTYKLLLNDNKRALRLIKQERSSSAIVFYWGISKKFDKLGLHNIFFSKEYETEFDFIFNKRQLYDDPTVYINITSKMEKCHAPEGKENWFVMINAPANSGQDWQQLKIKARNNILTKLGRLLQTPVEPLIESESILDPLNIEKRTMSYMGSLYGTSSNSKMAAFLRHPNFSSSIRGLYFVGGSVHPGGHPFMPSQCNYHEQVG